MKELLLIGDIHGQIHDYKGIIKGHQHSIQLGDHGVGFVPLQWLLDLEETHPYHKFFPGNHDNPEFCYELKRCLKPGLTEDGLFIIPGAHSIDKDYRTPGISWWREEELSEEKFEELFLLYLKNKPKIVLSHDCPTLVAYRMFLQDPKFKGFRTGFLQLSRTGEWLQKFYDYHQPEKWYFGHWHYSKTMTIGPTTFQCLNIGETTVIKV